MNYTMAIIGYGGMGAYHHEMLCKHKSPIVVKGAYDILPESIAKIKQKGLHVYNTPEELYGDRDIQLVLIATPNDMHRPYAIACLEAGKNVISEKPATLNAAELEEIIAVSRKEGVFYTVHQNRRWDSDFLTVKRILAEQTLKKPFAFESRVQGSRQYLHGWRGYKVNGGGMVYDWGAHLVDQMLQLIPEKILSVSAHLHAVSQDEVDDNFTAMFRFESGISYLINVAMHCFKAQPRWHICGENGAIVIEDWHLNGEITRLKEDNGTPEWDEVIVYTAAGPTRSMAPRPQTTLDQLPLPKVRGNWFEFYENMAACLAGTATPVVKPEESLRVARVMDAVFAANGVTAACEL